MARNRLHNYETVSRWPQFFSKLLVITHLRENDLRRQSAVELLTRATRVIEQQRLFWAHVHSLLKSQKITQKPYTRSIPLAADCTKKCGQQSMHRWSRNVSKCSYGDTHEVENSLRKEISLPSPEIRATMDFQVKRSPPLRVAAPISCWHCVCRFELAVSACNTCTNTLQITQLTQIPKLILFFFSSCNATLIYPDHII